MQTDRHDQICQIIDKSLAGATSQDQEQILRDHLRACAPCTEYLDASNRAIATLGGFSFDVDPGLDAKVLASLTQRSPPPVHSPHRDSAVWFQLSSICSTRNGSSGWSPSGSSRLYVCACCLCSCRFHMQEMRKVYRYENPSIFECRATAR
jgi:hypothetical protein